MSIPDDNSNFKSKKETFLLGKAYMHLKLEKYIKIIVIQKYLLSFFWSEDVVPATNIHLH